MPQRDRLLTCRSCGIRFLHTAADQVRRAASGHAGPPALCPGCAALAELGARRCGTVKWYDPHRGYGFISQSHGPDLFVHRSGLIRRNGPPLKKGQQVEFKVEHTPQGDRAVEVIAAGA
jgi:CspA family cold shock protein